MKGEGARLVVFIVGPTAVGKTDVAIQLAKHFKTAIISADSRQIYKGLEIGSAQPSEEQLKQVPHYFIATRNVNELYSAGDFERDALKAIANIHDSHNIAIVAGGTGLYVEALVNGLDAIPETDLDIRKALNERIQRGELKGLQTELIKYDPLLASRIDMSNTQRVVRALEVYYSTGKPLSHFLGRPKENRQFNSIIINLALPREELYGRIDTRVDSMIRAGLLEEASALYEYRGLNALKTVGYSEVFDFIDRSRDLSATIALIKQNTRRFAKRQITWFKRYKATYLHPDDFESILTNVNQTAEKLR